MAATYSVELADAFGNRLDIIDEWVSLKYARSVNGIGSMTLVLDGSYEISFLKLDGRVSIQRNKRLDTETVFLIRKIERMLDSTGKRIIVVTALSATELLSRRIVAYDSSGSTLSETNKTDKADDMMKQIVRENFVLGSVSDTEREISSYFTVEADTTLGPALNKEFPRDNVLNVLQEISQATVTAGSVIYFDVVAPTEKTLQFRTYRGLRGIDHSFPGGTNPVTLSTEKGNIANVNRTYDWIGEYTYVYAGGQDSGADRDIRTASSRERIGESPFNRRELFLSSNATSGSDALLNEADAALRAGRPVRSFEAEMVNVPGATEYGVHWGFGDRVTAEFEGESVDATIDVVEISVVKGKETIQASLRVEEQ